MDFFFGNVATIRILGLHKDAEDELVEEMMPSCCLLNALDCLFMNLSSYCKDKTKPQDV